MRIAVFSTKPYDREALGAANASRGHELSFFEAHLGPATADLAVGWPCVCPFVNDRVTAEVIETLAPRGLELLTLRSAGFNHVDLEAAAHHGVTVARVPAYSPHAVAEHAVALILGLNRHIPRAHWRVRDGNFSLSGLKGFDLFGKTVGVVGTGKIGAVFARIMRGFGCEVLAYDPYPSDACRDLVRYVDLDTLLSGSDIISLHCPLTLETHHLVDADALAKMRHGVMLINTGRGALIDTRAVIGALKSGRIGYLGLDVYEEEEGLFFEDLSGQVIRDDVFARLQTFPNVLVTAHQAFFTDEALRAIAETTLDNATAFERGEGTLHRVTAERVRKAERS